MEPVALEGGRQRQAYTEGQNVKRIASSDRATEPGPWAYMSLVKFPDLWLIPTFLTLKSLEWHSVRRKGEMRESSGRQAGRQTG